MTIYTCKCTTVASDGEPDTSVLCSMCHTSLIFPITPEPASHGQYPPNVRCPMHPHADHPQCSNCQRIRAITAPGVVENEMCDHMAMRHNDGATITCTRCRTKWPVNVMTPPPAPIPAPANTAAPSNNIVEFTPPPGSKPPTLMEIITQNGIKDAVLVGTDQVGQFVFLVGKGVTVERAMLMVELGKHKLMRVATQAPAQ